MPRTKTRPPFSKLDQPVYFWQPHKEGGYLGQWFPSPFTVDGERYATAEMWMMVQKARLFGDEESASKMLATEDPKTHRELGRLVEGFEEEKWEDSMFMFSLSLSLSLSCLSVFGFGILVRDPG